jgi:hypothetical protein
VLRKVEERLRGCLHNWLIIDVDKRLCILLWLLGQIEQQLRSWLDRLLQKRMSSWLCNCPLNQVEQRLLGWLYSWLLSQVDCRWPQSWLDIWQPCQGFEQRRRGCSWLHSWLLIFIDQQLGRLLLGTRQGFEQRRRGCSRSWLHSWLRISIEQLWRLMLGTLPNGGAWARSQHELPRRTRAVRRAGALARSERPRNTRGVESLGVQRELSRRTRAVRNAGALAWSERPQNNRGAKSLGVPRCRRSGINVVRHHALCLQFLHLALHHRDLLIDVVRWQIEDFVEKLLRICDGGRVCTLCQVPERFPNGGRNIWGASQTAA